MRHGIKALVFGALLAGATAASHAQEVELEGRSWTLTLAQDVGNWAGSEITFTSHEEDGSLGGFFLWETVNQTAFAVETFSGTLLEDGSFTLAGSELQPHPTLGGPQGVSLTDYTAEN